MGEDPRSPRRAGLRAGGDTCVLLARDRGEVPPAPRRPYGHVSVVLLPDAMRLLAELSAGTAARGHGFLPRRSSRAVRAPAERTCRYPVAPALGCPTALWHRSRSPCPGLTPQRQGQTPGHGSGCGESCWRLAGGFWLNCVSIQQGQFVKREIFHRNSLLWLFFFLFLTLPS